MAECLLVGRNFVSGICKLKPLKTLKPKNLFSYFFVKQRHRLLPAVLETRVFLKVNSSVLEELRAC